MSTSIKKISVSTPYKEESVRVPVIITIIILALIITPLVLWIMRIDDAGTRAANVSKFDSLIGSVQQDVRAVRAFLDNNTDELEAMRNAQQEQVVTLIVPEVIIVDEQKEQRIDPLKVDLEGIYWSPNNPLVSINEETYRVGDIIQGYEIIQIGKMAVLFQSPDGTVIEKDMYGDLLNGKNR